MKKRTLQSEEKKVFDWLNTQRKWTDNYFSCVEVCKGVKRNPNQSSYRILLRLTAFNLLEHKTVKKHNNRNCWGYNQIMVWRRKK